MFKRSDSIGWVCKRLGCDHYWRVLGAVRICQCRRRRCRYVHAAVVIVHDGARKAA